MPLRVYSSCRWQNCKLWNCLLRTHFSGITPNFCQALRFGNYIDIDKWNNMVTEDGGTPLVQWEDFITQTPRRLIILHIIKNDNKANQTSLTIACDENTTMCKTEQQIAHNDMQWIK